MKYPYIGKAPINDSKKCKDFDICVFYKPHCGIILESNSYHGKGFHSTSWCEQYVFKNITHEYLSNTWGVVESKEHAEFIIELAELHGFFIACEYSDSIKFFCTNNESLIFCRAKQNAKRERKQITMPLPPKTELPEAGHNLVFAAPECKEWPCVGDEVVTQCGSKGILVVSKPDNDGMILCDFDGEYVLAYLNELQKPKTPEEALRDELMQLMSNSYASVTEVVKDKSNFKHYVIDLMAKYNITPKEV